MPEPAETLDLLDYRRRVSDIYTAVRAGAGDQAAWHGWRQARDELFTSHPQSPFDAIQREAFRGLDYFPYDPAWRVSATVEPAESDRIGLSHSASGETRARLFGIARFVVGDGVCRLPLFWLEQYGGGVFLPFRDTTNGTATYGGGRYLLDTTKGADLGHVGTRMVLDFNYAYHPSCVHNDRWSCPLAPRESALDLAVRAGERLAPHSS